MKNFRCNLLALLVLILSLGLGKSANAQIAPDFTWTSNCLYVSFTDLSTVPLPDSLISWSWNFGDGNISYSESPFHTYADTGTYTVSLLVWSSGFDSAAVSYNVFIDTCDYNKINGFVFRDNDSDGIFNSSAGDFAWAGQVVQTIPGPYFAVTDATGNYSIDVPAGTYTVEVAGASAYLVTEPVSPYTITFPGLMGVEDDVDFGLASVSADFSWSINCNTAFFTDLSTTYTAGDSVSFWHWDFGDGDTTSIYLNDPNPLHVYADTGTYTVTLLVYSSAGLSHSVSYDIFISGCGNKVNGLVYFDNDGDGIFSSGTGDLGVAEHYITATPGPYYGVSDEFGNYSISVPAGTYAIDFSPPSGLTTTEPTSPYSVTFLGPTGVEDDIDFGYTPTIPIQDLAISAHTTIAPNPGANTQIQIDYSNLGNISVSGVLSYTHDPTLTFTSAYPAPDSYSGGVLTWNLPNVLPLTGSLVTVNLDVPTSAMIGDVLTGQAQIDPIVGDVDPANNQVLTEDVVGTTVVADFNWTTNCNTVIFSDNSIASAADTVAYWTWNFGDGNYSSDRNPIHIYADTGTYQVRLKVTTGIYWNADSLVYDVFVDACDDYNKINGLVYYDADADGTFSGATGDVGWPGQLVKATPGPYYGISDGFGNYSISVPAGTYTVEDVGTAGLIVTEPISPYSISFPGLMGIEDDVDFGYVPASPVQDLSITALMSIPPVPGFSRDVLISFTNEGNTFMSGTVTYTHDPTLSFVSASPAPDSYSGGVLSWNFINQMPLTSAWITATFDVPTSATIGGILTGQAHIDPVIGDANPANNDDITANEVVASYDPNDKLVNPVGIGVEGNIPMTTEWLNYTIRFQNTGNFMATNVVLVDTIDQAKLDMSTFQVIGASHPYEVAIEDHSTVVWSFEGINLPDSTTDLEGSSGFISFRIKPNTVYPGLEINNFADIYFDFNEPIRTNTTRSTYSTMTGLSAPLPVSQLNVYPNPATEMILVETASFIGADFCVFGIDGATELCGQISNSTTQLDISSLSAGTYLLKVTSNKGFGEALIEIVK